MTYFGQESRLAGTLLASSLALTASLAAQAAPGGRPPGDERATPQRAATTRWFDNAHNHSRSYPASGMRVRALPARTPPRVWGGTSYWFRSGVWYAPAAGGCVVVRPPNGIVVNALPDFRTVVMIGGITYLYLNGVYYQERTQGDYEVVPSPVAGIGMTSGAPGRLVVYPAQAQSAEVQSSDEYECHLWAISHAGFDPAPACSRRSHSGKPRPRRRRATRAMRCLSAAR